MTKLRNFFRGALALALTVSLTFPAFAAHAGRTFGAIRWDPWYNIQETSQRVAVEASLSPSQYQGRAPVCATVVNSYTLNTGSCNSQAAMDTEINAAAGANIDYWVFGTYGLTNTPLNAYTLYANSSVKSKVNYCLIFYGYGLFETEMASSAAAYATQMKQPNWQTVLSGRPLLYLLDDGTSLTALATAITQLRSAATTAGTGNPYIVLMTHLTTNVLTASGADAISTYSSQGTRGAYSDLVATVEAYWNTEAATGQPVVPTAMTGFDRRPRIQRPLPNEASVQAAYMGMNNYYASGTPTQIAAHIGDLMTWLSNHTGNAPAQTSLAYSWSEHDEGGSTLSPTLGGGNAILTAVGGAL